MINIPHHVKRSIDQIVTNLIKALNTFDPVLLFIQNLTL